MESDENIVILVPLDSVDPCHYEPARVTQRERYSPSANGRWYIYHLPPKKLHMALSIKNPETDRLAHELANATGETVTMAVTKAIRLRLDALNPRSSGARLIEDVRHIQQLVASLPDRDPRSAEEIIGYDEFGLPA